MASIRDSKAGPRMAISVQPNGFSARHTTVFALLLNAYEIRPTEDIPGLPSWARSEEFDIDAKMDDELASSLQKLPDQEVVLRRRQMLQRLLADRFKLRAHYEAKERSIYALVIAKGGPHLIATTGSDTGHGSSWGHGHIEIHAGSVSDFAFCMSDMLDRFVVDNTGIKGRFNVQLTWTPHDLQDQGAPGPTVFTALQEQLGLKLVPSKGPVPILIVDHLEKPSQN